MSPKRSSLKKFIILTFLLSALIPLIIISLYSFIMIRNQILREASMRLHSNLEIASLLLELKKEEVIIICRNIASDEYVKQMIKLGLTEYLKARLHQLTLETMKEENYFYYILDNNGKVLSSSNNEILIKFIDDYLTYLERGNEAVAIEHINNKNIFQNDKEDNFVILAGIPIFSFMDVSIEKDSEKHNKILGFIFSGYIFNANDPLIKKISLKTSSEVKLKFRNSIHTKEEKISKTDQMKEFKKVVLVERENLVGYLPLMNISRECIGFLKLVLPRGMVLEVGKKIILNFIIYFIFTFIVAIILGLIFLRQIISPINFLVKGVEEIGKGNLSSKINIKRDDEIGILAEAINNMTFQLHSNLNEIIKSKQQLEIYSNKLSETISRLEKANKVKDTFLSTVSHELKTPLTTILGYVSLLLKEIMGKLNEEQKEAISNIEKKGKFLKALIGDLLDISKIDAGKLELNKTKFKVEKELNSIREIFNESINEKKLNVSVEVDKNLEVFADRERFSQIMINIIGNAVKFTPKNGFINITAYETESSTCIVIKDSGIGISADQKELIFERFYQVANKDNREYGGTGLGLSIAKDLTELHCGKITVESEIGKGSKFIVEFPKIDIN